MKNIKEEILNVFSEKYIANAGNLVPFYLKEPLYIKQFISEAIDKVIAAKNKECREMIESCPIEDYSGYKWINTEDDYKEGRSDVTGEVTTWQEELLNKLK